MTKLIVFKATGEVRRAKQREWFKDSFEGMFEQCLTAETLYSHPIFTRHEIEPTPDVLRALGMEEEG